MLKEVFEKKSINGQIKVMDVPVFKEGRAEKRALTEK